MAPHSSTVAWKIPWTEEPGRLQSMGSLQSDTIERLHFHFSLSCIGERNGNPLQCSCMEYPRDGGAWWAAVYGVAQSRTRLKRLSSSSSGSNSKEFPDAPVVRTSGSHCQGPTVKSLVGGVQSLIGKVRSHRLCSMAINKITASNLLEEKKDTALHWEM